MQGVHGTAPYTFTLNGDTISNAQQAFYENLVAGDYSIEVADSNGCSPKTYTVTVHQPAVPSKMAAPVLRIIIYLFVFLLF